MMIRMKMIKIKIQVVDILPQADIYADSVMLAMYQFGQGRAEGTEAIAYPVTVPSHRFQSSLS